MRKLNLVVIAFASLFSAYSSADSPDVTVKAAYAVEKCLKNHNPNDTFYVTCEVVAGSESPQPATFDWHGCGDPVACSPSWNNIQRVDGLFGMGMIFLDKDMSVPGNYTMTLFVNDVRKSGSISPNALPMQTGASVTLVLPDGKVTQETVIVGTEFTETGDKDIFYIPVLAVFPDSGPASHNLIVSAIKAKVSLGEHLRSISP